MLDSISLSIDSGIYLNLRLISQSEANFTHSPAHFRGVRLAPPVGLGGCPGWPGPGGRGGVV